MTSESNPENSPVTSDDHDRLEAARREKLRKIAALGVDPWGGRFDDRTLIGDIRDRRVLCGLDFHAFRRDQPSRRRKSEPTTLHDR